MNQGMNFAGARVWITGASSGIGAELARQLAQKGAGLVLSARNVEALESVAEQCRELGAVSARVLPLDVAVYADAGPAADTVWREEGPVDLLVNNAGVSQRSFCIDTDFSVYQRMLEINVLGQIALTQAILPAMIERGSGHLAVTSSVAGKLGAPLRTGYCAAKHAVMGFFDALRSEVAMHGLEVTTITPGFIRTDVARNALGPDGKATGANDENIDGGMPVEACVSQIVAGFENGDPEIAVGGDMELAMLKLRCADPEAAFGAMAQMAEQIAAGGKRDSG